MRGIPRKFEALEREGLYPPELQLEADAIFTVTLRNTPIHGPEPLRWLRQFGPLGLSGNQKRLLAYAREHDGTFTNRAYQGLTHVDPYTASREIRDLVRRGIVGLPSKRGRMYHLAPDLAAPLIEKPTEYTALEARLRALGYIQNRDIRGVLDVPLA